MTEFLVGPLHPTSQKDLNKKNDRLNDFQISFTSFVKDQTLTSCSFNDPENQKKAVAGGKASEET